MRLAAQVKVGFYPVPPTVVEQVLDCLSPNPNATMMDPCCGRGAALVQFSENLCIPPAKVYGIEMDGVRSQAARRRLPAANLLLDTDYLSSQVSSAKLSFAWVNPPYDDELGGGRRYEYSFLVKTTPLLCKGGILALACPERVAQSPEIGKHMAQWYEHLCTFPYGDRQYGEVVVMGRKKGKPTEGEAYEFRTAVRSGKPKAYTLPDSPGPGRFQKGGMTETELAQALARSRLSRMFEPPPPLLPPRPGLQLSAGQRALVLAGGFLDGVLQKPGHHPIVVKSTPHKVSVTQPPVVDEDEATGKTKVVTIIQQHIRLLIRVLRTDGVIVDLTQE